MVLEKKNMAKINDSVWGIFSESVKFYFNNFGSFFRYLAFPVLGQIVGILLTLLACYVYAENLPKWVSSGGIFDNFSMIFLVLIIIILPGLFVFTKAVLDYLVAYGAINSMTDNMLKSGKVYDFAAHTELITRRTSKFMGLWVLFGVFSSIATFPLFWVVGGILFIYFILIFQVFTFEPDKSPFGCFKKSFNIIKGNFARTFGLMFLIGTLTYWILPELSKFLFDFFGLTGLLAIPLDSWTNQLPIKEINAYLLTTPFAYQITSLMIAKLIVSGTIGYLVVGFTLPLRSICWSLWYKNLNKGEMKLDKRILDKVKGSKYSANLS